MPTALHPGARRVILLVGLALVALAAVLLLRHLVGMGMLAAGSSRTLVTFGDSLTDGGDVARPWPAELASRLPRGVAVVNAGISGNRLLRGGMGASGLERFQKDVLARSRVRWVTVLEGTNDLGFAGSVEPGTAAPTAAELIAAYRQLIDRAHAAGLKIYGGTLPPFEGTTTPGYFTPEKEVVRQAVNAWIRTSGAFDAVIDFDQVLRDPAHPARLLPAFDSDDHLHPSAAGHRAMARAVPMSLLD